MRCTVITPTLDHQDTLNFSIASVLAQTHQDFELLVIGDGAPPRTDEIMNEWCQKDSRIKYFPHPKGAGYGELYRHEAILASTGEAIFYLSDDDLWLEDHLSVLMDYLRIFDLVNTSHTTVLADGSIVHRLENLASHATRGRMLREKWNIMGLSCTAHTKEAYFKLPIGWNPKPEGIWSDLHMWRQWVAQPWARCYSIPAVTSLHFAASLRVGTPLSQRIAELTEFVGQLANPPFRQSLHDRFAEQVGQEMADENIEISAAVYQDLERRLADLQERNRKLKDRNERLAKRNESLIENKNKQKGRIEKLVERLRGKGKDS